MKSITVITISVIVILGSALADYGYGGYGGYGGGYSGGLYPSYGGGYGGGYGYGGSGGFGLLLPLILIIILLPMLFNQGSTDTIRVVNVGKR